MEEAFKIEKTFEIRVDYGKSIDEMVLVGKYDRVGLEFYRMFSMPHIQGVQELKLDLIEFARFWEFDVRIGIIGCAGYRPAILPELLSSGSQHPELQRDFVMVALGSIDNHVPVLRSYPSTGRCLCWPRTWERWVAFAHHVVVRR